MQRAEKKLFKGTPAIMLARALVFSLAFLKFLFLANRFGSSESTDAYFMSFGFTYLIIIGVGGTLYTTFTPLFIEYKEKKGEKEALLMARSFLSVLLLFFFFVCVLMYFLAPYVIFLLAPGFNDKAHLISCDLVRLFSVWLFISAPIPFFASIYHSYERFTLPAFASILPMLGALLGLLFFSEKFGIRALPLGMMGFSAIQLAWLIFGIQDKTKCLLRLTLRIHGGIKEFLRQGVPRFIDFTILEVNLVIDRFFASLLGAGFVSALAYGSRIAVISCTLLTLPFVVSMFPSISNFAAHNDKDAIARSVLKGIRIFALVLIPWSVFLMVFGGDVVKLIFQHGEFSYTATSLTAQALLFYSFGILFYGLNPLIRMVFFSFQDSVNLLKITLLALFANVVLNMIFMRFLGHGGIALATSLVAVIRALCLVNLLSHRLKRPLLYVVFKQIVKPVLAAVFTFTLLKLIYNNFVQNIDTNIGCYMGLLMVSGIVVYMGVFFLLKQKVNVQ